MGIWTAILDEVRADKTAELLAVAVVLVGVTRALAAAHRERLRSSIVLIGLYVLLVPIAGALRAMGTTIHAETRLAALLFVTFAFIQILGTLVFAAALPRLRISVPRIEQDVLIAGLSLIAVFMLASRAGVNLSGLIATSAVLTVVIGLASQDTLGNIVGGLAIQLDDSVSVGDWIKVGDVVGRVTEIRWRYTAIETRNWETVILPNSLLVKGQVTVLGRRTGKPIQWRRWVHFNVDFRYPPSDVMRVVLEALQDADIERVSTEPKPNCVLMDVSETYGHYAVRYWLTDLAVDDPTDSVIRTRIYFALRRAGIPLSMPAHAVFLSEDSTARRETKSRVEAERRKKAIGGVELFADLSDAERSRLAEHLRYAPFAPGETITRQGAEAHWLYVLAEGEVSIRVVEDGVEGEVAHLHAGDFFGEMSLLTGERRTATVVALTPVECYRLDKAAFQELLVERPQVTEQIADVLAKRRTELASVREDLDHEAARERMRVTRTDLIDKIRSFFSLDDVAPSESPPST